MALVKSLGYGGRKEGAQKSSGAFLSAPELFDSVKNRRYFPFSGSFTAMKMVLLPRLMRNRTGSPGLDLLTAAL